MTKLRVYGCTVGHGSFARVTHGVVGALQDLGAFAGLVPIDAFDEETVYEGAQAPSALFIGPPGKVAFMSSYGWHERRWALLPPNSTWVPDELFTVLWKSITGIVAPSRWAAQVLGERMRAFRANQMPPYDEPRALDVYPHGVSAAFRPAADYVPRMAAAKARGEFSVLHLASTARARKGTRELVEAWGALVRTGKLGKQPTLRLLVDGPDDCFRGDADNACRGNPGAVATYCWSRRSNLSEAAMTLLFQQHHVVCQPSRGEGFGLVPLEARAAGVPVVTTQVTGHSEHMPLSLRPDRDGVIFVPTGSLAPIDDGPGALAPSLDAGKLADAVLEAYQRWEELARGAQAQAPRVSEMWSWRAVTRAWLMAEGGSR